MAEFSFRTCSSWLCAMLYIICALCSGCGPSPRELADLAFAAGDYATAAGLYGSSGVVQSDEIIKLRGLALARAGRDIGAAQILSALPEAHVDAEVQAIRIQARLSRGEVVAATTAARALVDANPRDLWAQLALGDALAAGGDLTNAAQQFRNAQAISSQNVEGLIGLGNVAFASGDPTGAEQLYRQAIELGGGQSGGVEARARLARLQAANGRGMDAEILLQEALSIQPTHPVALAEYGKQRVRNGHLEDALGPLSEAQQALGEDAELMSYLGFVFLQRARAQYAMADRVKDLQAAQMWLHRAVQREPRRADIHNNLGQAKVLLGDTEGAEQAFVNAFEAAPDQIESLLNLGRLYAEGGQLERAQSVLERALQIAPSHVIAQMNLGVLSLREGDEQAADRWFGEVATGCANMRQNHPCHPELAFNRARLLGRQRQIDQGVESLERAIMLGFVDLGRLEAEPDLAEIRGDIRIANLIDALRMRNSN